MASVHAWVRSRGATTAAAAPPVGAAPAAPTDGQGDADDDDATPEGAIPDGTNAQLFNDTELAGEANAEDAHRMKTNEKIH